MCSNFPSAKRQCPSCSVKLHLNIYIVCNLSNLSQWNISKRYTYYIYILKCFMSLSFEHYYLIHVSACAWARVGCCAGCQSTSCFPNHLSNTFEAATGPCAYFHSNSSPAQHSQTGHPLPSPAKQTKTRKKTLLITQPPPAEFFYDDVHPASGPRSSRWGLKCSNKCSDVIYPPCHHSCDTQQKPCVMLTASSINPAWDHFK